MPIERDNPGLEWDVLGHEQAERDEVVHVFQPKPGPEGDSNRDRTAASADNGADAGSPPATPFPTVCAASYQGIPAPPLNWLDDRQMFPGDHVTLLTGAGGVGKTRMALQLLFGAALKGLWLGRPVNRNGRGTALFYSAEEPEHHVHCYLGAICDYEGVAFSDLTGLHIQYAVDEPGLFVQGPRSEIVIPTPNFHRLVATVASLQPDLLVIDNRGQVVYANELSRIIAHMTITALAQFGRRNNPTAVVLLAHPSLTGINTGTGLSSSTGWGFSARAHVDMTQPAAKDEDGSVRPDSGVRRLTLMKTNNGRIGETVNVIWDQGVYRCTDEPPRADEGIGAQDKRERVFLALLRWHNERNINVSASLNSGSYAPKLFAAHSGREGLVRKDFMHAMEALLAVGKIENRQVGAKWKNQFGLYMPE